MNIGVKTEDSTSAGTPSRVMADMKLATSDSVIGSVLMERPASRNSSEPIRGQYCQSINQLEVSIHKRQVTREDIV